MTPLTCCPCTLLITRPHWSVGWLLLLLTGAAPLLGWVVAHHRGRRWQCCCWSTCTGVPSFQTSDLFSPGGWHCAFQIRIYPVNEWRKKLPWLRLLIYIFFRGGMALWLERRSLKTKLSWSDISMVTGSCIFPGFIPTRALSLSFRAACFPLFYCYFWSLFCTTCIDLTRTAVFGDGSLHKVVQMHRKRKQIIGGWNRLMWLHSAVSHLDDRVESGTTSNISKYSLYWFWAIMVPSRDLFIGPSATQVWGQLNFIIESLEDPRYSDILTS